MEKLFKIAIVAILLFVVIVFIAEIERNIDTQKENLIKTIQTQTSTIKPTEEPTQSPMPTEETTINPTEEPVEEVNKPEIFEEGIPEQGYIYSIEDSQDITNYLLDSADAYTQIGNNINNPYELLVAVIFAETIQDTYDLNTLPDGNFKNMMIEIYNINTSIYAYLNDFSTTENLDSLNSAYELMNENIVNTNEAQTYYNNHMYEFEK